MKRRIPQPFDWPLLKGDVDHVALGASRRANDLDWWRWRFAGLAMQGCIACNIFEEQDYAEVAVEYADALIEELLKE